MCVRLCVHELRLWLEQYFYVFFHYYCGLQLPFISGKPASYSLYFVYFFAAILFEHAHTNTHTHFAAHFCAQIPGAFNLAHGKGFYATEYPINHPFICSRFACWCVRSHHNGILCATMEKKCSFVAHYSTLSLSQSAKLCAKQLITIEPFIYELQNKRQSKNDLPIRLYDSCVQLSRWAFDFRHEHILTMSTSHAVRFYW